MADVELTLSEASFNCYSIFICLPIGDHLKRHQIPYRDSRRAMVSLKMELLFLNKEQCVETTKMESEWNPFLCIVGVLQKKRSSLTRDDGANISFRGTIQMKNSTFVEKKRETNRQPCLYPFWRAGMWAYREREKKNLFTADDGTNILLRRTIFFSYYSFLFFSASSRRLLPFIKLQTGRSALDSFDQREIKTAHKKTLHHPDEDFTNTRHRWPLVVTSLSMETKSQRPIPFGRFFWQRTRANISIVFLLITASIRLFFY